MGSREPEGEVGIGLGNRTDREDDRTNAQNPVRNKRHGIIDLAKTGTDVNFSCEGSKSEWEIDTVGFTSCGEGFGGGAEHVFENHLNQEPNIRKNEIPGNWVRVAGTSSVKEVRSYLRLGSDGMRTNAGNFQNI